MENKERFSITGYMEKYGHEQLITFYDKETGLKGFTGIHNTNLGPALGGTRFWNYDNEEEAIYDVLRLSRGMAYKNAAMQLPLGGGKTVIMGDSSKLTGEARAKFFQALGRFVESLNGRYVTAEDINVSSEDCVNINKQTNHVVGLPGKSGNPSPVTAWGVYQGMKETAQFVFGTDSLEGRTIAVQGAGQTGYFLIKHILKHEKPAKIYFTEINESHIARMAKEHPEVEFVKPELIFGLEVDIFAPCAMGAQLNKDTIGQFKCKMIAGSANNCIHKVEDGEALFERGIVYAPDYVANGGGVINVYAEIKGNYNEEETLEVVKNQIRSTLAEIFKISKEENMPEFKVADKLMEKRMEEGNIMAGIYLKKDTTPEFLQRTTGRLGEKKVV